MHTQLARKIQSCIVIISRKNVRNTKFVLDFAQDFFISLTKYTYIVENLIKLN